MNISTNKDEKKEMSTSGATPPKHHRNQGQSGYGGRGPGLLGAGPGPAFDGMGGEMFYVVPFFFRPLFSSSSFSAALPPSHTAGSGVHVFFLEIHISNFENSCSRLYNIVLAAFLTRAW